MARTLPIWQVDAFAARAFAGNPAAVLVTDAPLPDALMQHIAAEMNLSETAFVVRRAGAPPALRWFTVTGEIDLCGHATLAAGHVWLTDIAPGDGEVVFETVRSGTLSVTRAGAGRYTIDLPARPPEPVALGALPPFVLPALSPARPVEALRYANKTILVYDDPGAVRAMRPDFATLQQWNQRIVPTAPSDAAGFDFISRHFNANDPAALEDPVCGSAHCLLAPYWAARLGRPDMRAWQASARGGALDIVLGNGRVRMTGGAVCVIYGTIRLPDEREEHA
jgi:PhzF family phenazine biosynthesis protein